MPFDDDDFQEEIRAHLAIAAQEKVEDGVDRDEARYAALREFGNVTLTREAARRVWTPRWLETVRDVLKDARYAIRALARNPLFALTVVGVLTLGIGLNAAVFTILKGVWLTPVGGVPDATSLRVVHGETSTGRVTRLSYPDYQSLRDGIDGFASLMGSGFFPVNLGRGRSARQVAAELVTGNYFEVLGVRAQLGRTLLPGDEGAAGRQPVVVISDPLWRREFAADPAIVGKTIDINTYPLTVVGVADASFHGTIVSYDIEAFIPITMAAEIGVGPTSSNLLSDRRAGLLFAQGHPRRGTSVPTLTAQVDALGAVLAHDRPLGDALQRLRVSPFWRSPAGGQSYMIPTMVVLIAMGLLVLVIACANIAGLVLVRGISRRGEIAVRLALGASRRRIVRLLLVENLVLAIPGAVLGVVLARETIPYAGNYAQWLAAPQRIFFNVAFDGMVIAFTVLVACGSALVFGFVPALQSSRVDLVTVINEDASPRGASRGRMRSALVVAQVAVSLLLLVGAGLLTRSLDAARRADPGFDPQHVVSIAVDVKQNGYDEARGRVFYRKLLDAARAGGGVETATLAQYTPLGFLDTRVQRVNVEGYEPGQGEDLSFLWNTIAADYFRTLRVPVVAGRAIDERDDERAADVAMVNHNFAQRFWGSDANAIGKRLRGVDGKWRTVVGVAADMKYSRIDEKPRPYFYLPFQQFYRSQMVLQVRAAVDPAGGGVPVEQLLADARARVAALDGDLPLLYARPLVEQIGGAFIFLRLAAVALMLFGTAGLALAALGTYGLVSYAVRQSTHEIGIRLALGAPSRAVVREFLARGLRLGLIGMALGLALTLGLTRLLGTLLFGVTATDGPSYLRAIALVIGGVAIATLVPAWRASRTDPLTALRHQ